MVDEKEVDELRMALASLIGGVDNVNGQTIVQPHDVGFARAILAKRNYKTPKERDVFTARMYAAEEATSASLSMAPVTGMNEIEVTRSELIREALSLARTLVTEAKRIYQGGTVSKAGLVQGKGSQIDILSAELYVRLQIAGKQT